MAWKAFLIELEADVGILSEAVPETVRGIGVTGQDARRMGRRSRRRRVRIDWLKPARLGLQRMVQGNRMLVSFLVLVGRVFGASAFDPSKRRLAPGTRRLGEVRLILTRVAESRRAFRESAAVESTVSS